MKYRANFSKQGEIVELEIESKTQFVMAAAYSECNFKIDAGEIEYTPAAIASFMAGEISRLEAMAVAQ